MNFFQKLFARKKVYGELSDEIREHLDEKVAELVAGGMPRAEAEFVARREFGNLGLVEEEGRAAWRWPRVEELLSDVQYALRALWHTPTFTVVALLTIAIGIGANAAVFSVVNSVLLKPLNYPQADELVAIRQVAPGAAGLASFAEDLRMSPSMYFTYAENNRTFASLGVWITDAASVTGTGEPEQVRAVDVTDGVLQALGTPPAVGRWLTAADQVPHGPESVMLSYGYWQRRFGGDPSAIGRNIRVDARPREIAGVMPKGFRIGDTDFDLLVPLAFDRGHQILAGFGFQGVGRLKPGVTIAEANADLARALPIWMDSWTNGPGTNPKIYETWRITPAIRALKQDVVGNVSEALGVVMGTIGLVMLIACANLTNLLLVRTEARQQELAVRAALGATRLQIARGLLVENVLLGLLGGVLGMGFAAGGVNFLVATGPANLPRLSEISLDARTLVFTLLLAVACGLLFGLIPVWKYAGRGVSAALWSAGRTASVSRERNRARSLLVVGQVAMALVLLICAGLMIRTFVALRNVEPGFTDARRLQSMRISIPESLVTEPERVTRIENEIADRVAAIPGVSSAAFAYQLPMEKFGSAWDAVYAKDKVYSGGAIPPLRLFQRVSPGVFGTLGTRIVAGRDVTWADLYEGRPVVIVSDNLARELWGSAAEAVGKRLREYDGMSWREVIAVAQDVRENGVQEAAPEIVYWPAMMRGGADDGPLDATRTVTFAIRSERAGSEALISEIRRAVWAVNGNLPVASVRTLEEVYEKSVARTAFTLVMLGIAGAMAMALGVIGIYGVISYGVSQRKREIGIRLALGAQQSDVLRVVLAQGAKMAAAGVAVGVVIALGLTRLMASLLFGVTAHDPLTFAGVIVLLIGVALVASYLPARRATQVDPMVVLRYE
jgi:predicted permease